MSDDTITAEWHDWYQRQFNPDDPRPARRQVAQPAPASINWAEVIGEMCADERAFTEQQIAALRAEITDLRAELDVARRLAALEARLADVVSRETPRPPAGALRAV